MSSSVTMVQILNKHSLLSVFLGQGDPQELGMEVVNLRYHLFNSRCSVVRRLVSVYVPARVKMTNHEEAASKS